MRVALAQTSYESGAVMTLRTVLSEYDLPVDHRATVQAMLERPDRTTAALTLAEIEPGVFETTLTASLPGIYRLHLRADGRTLRGRIFTREQLVTGLAWRGGDQPPPTRQDSPGMPDEKWCKLLQCLLGHGVISAELEQELKRRGINIQRLRRCLAEYCRHSPKPSDVPVLPQAQPSLLAHRVDS